MSHFKDAWFRDSPFAYVPLRWNAIFVSVPILFGIGLLVLLRRTLGSFDSPLPPAALLATAALLVVWLAVVSDHWLEQPRNLTGGGILWNQIAVATAWSTFACFAVACSFPFTRLFDWLIWPMAFAAAWFGPRALPILRQKIKLFEHRPPASRAVAAPLDKNNALPIQTLTRYRALDGAETILAQLRAEFAPGERDATLHVAFCPPFTHLPTVEAYLTDDIPADVNLTQVLHHGAQIEIRLPRPAPAPLSASVELVASESTEFKVKS